MADENTQAAESSPAPQAVPTGSADYANWRMTGKLPAGQPSKNEHSGASERPAESGSASEAGKEAGKPQEKPRSNAQTRLDELLGDLKRAGLSPAELKTYKREAQQAAKAEQTEKPAESAKGPEAPKKPEADKFDSWEKYEAARDKYYEDLADYKAQKAVADHQARLRQEAGQRELQAKFAEAKTRYGDEAEATIVSAAKTIGGDAQIASGVKAMLDQSPVLTDLLYVLGSKPDELAEFASLARTNPAAAIRKMVLLENLVADELRKGAAERGDANAAAPGETAKRDDAGKFAPAKKVTGAPPPPREASARAAAPADEVEAAASNNDFARFRNAANRRDFARRKGN